MRCRFSRSGTFWWMLCLMCMLGCGEKSNRVTVSGNVTLDGEPIEIGTIRFVDKSGLVPSAAGPIENGKYSVQIEPGEKKVMIQGYKVDGYLSMVGPSGEKAPNLVPIVPDAYNSERASLLTTSITEAVDDLDFECDSKGKKVSAPMF